MSFVQLYTRFRCGRRCSTQRLPSGASASASASASAKHPTWVPDSEVTQTLALVIPSPNSMMFGGGVQFSIKNVHLSPTTTITPHPPLAITMPMSVLEHADSLMQDAAALFGDNESFMKDDYRIVAEDKMIR